MAAAIGVGLALIVIGIAAQGRHPRAHIPTLLVAAGLCLSLSAYFFPGDIPGGDAHSHLARTFLVADALSAGTAPLWTPRWYMGFELGALVGYGYYGPSAILSPLLPSFFLSQKLALFTLHLGSAFAFFLLLRRLQLSSPSASAGALFYACSPQHIGLILHSGALPLSVLFFILPSALLLLIPLAARTPPPWANSRVAASSALLAWGLHTHPQYGAFTLVAVLLAWAAVWLVGERRPGLPRFMGQLTRVMIFTALLALPALVSFHLSSAGLMLNATEEVARDVNPAQNLLRLSGWFMWSKGRPDWVIHYVGVAPLALCLIDVVHRVKKRDARGNIWLLLLACALLSSIIVPRMGVMAFFFVCIASAVAIDRLQSSITSPIGARMGLGVAACAALITGLELAPTLIVNPYHPLTLDQVEAAQTGLHDPGIWGRVVSVSPTRATLWPSLEVMASGASTIFGGFPQGAPRVYPISVGLISEVAHQLFNRGEGEVSEELQRRLALLNVARLSVQSEPPRIIEIAAAKPVWLVRTAQHSRPPALEASPDWWALREAYEKNSPELQAQVSALRGMETQTGGSIAAPSDFEITAYQETWNHLSFQYTSAQDGLAWLPMAFNAGLSAERDQATATDTLADGSGFLMLPIPAGSHRIDVHYDLPHPVKLAWLITLTCALGLCGLVVAEWRAVS